jgi:hypothetical protein
VRPAPSAAPNTVPLSLSVLAGHSGSDLHVTLELLFQEQLYLAAATMQAAANTRLDESGAANILLDQDAATLGPLVAAVSGQAKGDQALAAWRAVNGDLLSYAQGSNQSAARADLDAQRMALAGALALGDVSADAVSDRLRARFEAQLDFADAVAAHDAQRAVTALRTAAANTDGLVAPLSAAIAARAPDQVAPPTSSPEIDLRVNFGRLLQERVLIVAMAADATANQRADEQQALVQAADANADEIGTLLGNAYGADLGSRVANDLRSQTAAYVSASGGDRSQASADIERARNDVDAAISGTNALLPRGLLAQEMRAVDQPLLTTADAFTARDWGAAYNRIHEAARQSQKVSDSLSQTIVDRYPGRFLVTPTPRP